MANKTKETVKMNFKWNDRCKNCEFLYWNHKHLGKEICKGFEFKYACVNCERELSKTEETFIEVDKADCYSRYPVCESCIDKTRILTQDEYDRRYL